MWQRRVKSAACVTCVEFIWNLLLYRTGLFLQCGWWQMTGSPAWNFEWECVGEICGSLRNTVRMSQCLLYVTLMSLFSVYGFLSLLLGWTALFLSYSPSATGASTISEWPWQTTSRTKAYQEATRCRLPSQTRSTKVTAIENGKLLCCVATWAVSLSLFEFVILIRLKISLGSGDSTMKLSKSTEVTIPDLAAFTLLSTALQPDYP